MRICETLTLIEDYLFTKHIKEKSLLIFFFPRNLTVSDIYNAKPTFSKCPFCGTVCQWNVHRDVCKGAGASEFQDRHHPTIQQDWRVCVKIHKTRYVPFT